jgi:hypothetical protein
VTVALSVAVSFIFSFRFGALSMIFVTSRMTATLQVAFFPLPSLAVAVIVAVPYLIALTLPSDVTVATDLLLVVHFTFLLFALEGPTVAVSVAVFLASIVSVVLFSFTLVTGCLTVTVQAAFFPLPSAAVAVIVAVPFLTPLTAPVEETVATELLLVVHFTFLLSALEGPTVAVSVAVAPLLTVRDVLFSVRLVTGCLTVILHSANTPLPSLAAALMTAVPFAAAVTFPLLLTAATPGLPLFQVNERVGEGRAASATLAAAEAALMLGGELAEENAYFVANGEVSKKKVATAGFKKILVTSFATGGSYSAVVLGK